MEKNYQKSLGFVGLNHGFLKFGIGIGFGFETFPVLWLGTDSVSKKFGIEKSIGFGIGKIWYRKKYRIRYRKNLVSKKVSDSVSEKIWYQKKYWIRYQKYLVSEKRFGIVTHWPKRMNFRKSSEGGVISNPKIYVADFCQSKGVLQS